jgi:hypothetical protein
MTAQCASCDLSVGRALAVDAQIGARTGASVTRSRVNSPGMPFGPAGTGSSILRHARQHQAAHQYRQHGQYQQTQQHSGGVPPEFAHPPPLAPPAIQLRHAYPAVSDAPASPTVARPRPLPDRAARRRRRIGLRVCHRHGFALCRRDSRFTGVPQSRSHSGLCDHFSRTTSIEHRLQGAPPASAVLCRWRLVEPAWIRTRTGEGGSAGSVQQRSLA